MPLLKSKYQKPFFFQTGHFQTIYPFVFRRVGGVEYKRERIDTHDGDFLDLDWSKVGGKNLVLLAHGLEGSSNQKYILGMVKIFNAQGIDTVSLNFRSCSGEMNRSKRFYHSGETEDISHIVDHILKSNNYDNVFLIGFSLGANVIVKYLGEGRNLDERVRGSVVFSCPFNLNDCAPLLTVKGNKIYLVNFLATLKLKLIKKSRQMKLPEIDIKRALLARSIEEWDDYVTAPTFGFTDSQDYYNKASSGQFISTVARPTLVVNAKNDPILGDGCYPYDDAHLSRHVHLETPKDGGHVGFIDHNSNKEYWSERRALDFVLSLLKEAA